MTTGDKAKSLYAAAFEVLRDTLDRLMKESTELARLRGLLQSVADSNDGAVSTHCCPHCPWCSGDGWTSFMHTNECPIFTPDGKLK